VLAEVTAREIGRVTIAEALGWRHWSPANSRNATAASPPSGFASISRNTSRRRSRMSSYWCRTCDRSRPERTTPRHSRFWEGRTQALIFGKPAPCLTAHQQRRTLDLGTWSRKGRRDARTAEEWL